MMEPPQKTQQRTPQRRLSKMKAVAPMIFCLGAAACTVQSSISNHYLTGEKLWTEKNYLAAVSEFDRVVKESPNSAIGLQSLWRASTTRELFLNQPEEALKGFELFLERASSSDLAPQAKTEIGDIFFSRLMQYQKAADYYETLLNSKKYSAEEGSKFMYRIARSNLLSNRIKKAIEWYELGISRYPASPYFLKMKFDLAHAWYAIGDTDRTSYSRAQKLFQELKLKVKETDHRLFVECVFGEASALEEEDRLEEAFEMFQSIQNDYPAPNVIRVRILRLSERMKKKRK